MGPGSVSSLLFSVTDANMMFYWNHFYTHWGFFLIIIQIPSLLDIGTNLFINLEKYITNSL